MSDGSSIQWCDATWTIAVGCTRASSGCDNCYAATFVHRALHETHRGLTKIRPKNAARPGVDWTGEVRTLPHRLVDPLRWVKPRRVFVGSMTDLFHYAVPFEYVAAVFGVMAACPQHTFLVLTKRPERAREFFVWMDHRARAEARVTSASCFAAALNAGADVNAPPPGVSRTRWSYEMPPNPAWPLPNVHLGVSVEDQRTADERIPVLLELPAALRWVSYEPALGLVDFKRIGSDPLSITLPLAGLTWRMAKDGVRLCEPHKRVGWVVVGGESGPRARPFMIEWASAVVEQCREAGTPVFVKQLGSDPSLPLSRPTEVRRELTLRDYAGGDMDEWREHGLDHLCVREVPA